MHDSQEVLATRYLVRSQYISSTFLCRSSQLLRASILTNNTSQLKICAKCDQLDPNSRQRCKGHATRFSSNKTVYFLPRLIDRIFPRKDKIEMHLDLEFLPLNHRSKLTNRRFLHYSRTRSNGAHVSVNVSVNFFSTVYRPRFTTDANLTCRKTHKHALYISYH